MFFNVLRCFYEGSDCITNDGLSTTKPAASLFYITTVLFTLQSQAVSESTHVAVQLIIVKYSRDKFWGFPHSFVLEISPERGAGLARGAISWFVALVSTLNAKYSTQRDTYIFCTYLTCTYFAIARNTPFTNTSQRGRLR